MTMPVLVPLDVTLPLKVIVLALLETMLTTVFARACEMLPPQVIVPLPPPVTLNAGLPAMPVIVPADAPHVPVTPDRMTLPAVAVTLANVPLTAPVVRLRAVVAETLTELPMVSVPKFVVLLMPVAGPVIVTPASVRLVFAPCSETPVVPLEI